jgi:hypothetical protein
MSVLGRIILPSLAEYFCQDVTPTPFSEDDGTTIIAQVQGIQPIIINALNGIVGLKPEFDSCQGLDVSNILVVDLKDLSSATTALETALIAASPVCLTFDTVIEFKLNAIYSKADLQANATAIQTAINTALSSACTAYGSSC